MKHWKKQGKRGLSLFLSVVMCLSMVNLTAFAEETSGKIVSQKEDWTMTDDGSVGHKKTIRKTGENTFEITLSVKTKEEIAQQVTSPDAAVVVVMDVSNSMKETVNGGEAKNEADQRITKAKAAAEKFIEDFAADAGNAQRQVALVEFGSNAMTVQNWTDAATAKNSVSKIGINFGTPACTIQGQHTHEENTIEWGGFLGLTWRCTEKDCPLSKGSLLLGGWYPLYNSNYEGHTHEKTYDGPHGDVTKDGGGTNIEGGLQLADNLLATCNVPNKYVVLITDGVPTYHVYRDHYISGNTNFIEGQKGGGNYAAQSDYVNVPTVARSIKSKGTLYTVSYASSTVKETVGGKSIDAWLSSFATKNVPAGDRIDLGLGSVSDTIKNQAKAWILTDPIPAPYIVYKPEDNESIPSADENPNSVLNYKTYGTGTTLTWNLKDDTATESTEGGVTWYNYSTSYVVRLDTAAKDFVEDYAYPTNGITTLTYMLTKDGVLQSDLKSTNLVVPAVSGTLPMVEWRIEYYKQDGVDSSGKPTYPETPNETTKGGPDKLWTKVELKAEDPEWETKYDNYTAVGVNQVITIQADSENVIKVYYNLQPAQVIVNHWVITKDITDGGASYTIGEEPGDVAVYPAEGEKLYIGDLFSNSKYLELPRLSGSVTIDGTEYKSDKDQNVKVETANGTVINLYYVQEGTDQRTKVTYDVNYYYREDKWELVDFQYKLVEGEYVKDEELSKAGLEAFLIEGTKIAAAQDDNGAYTLDTEESTPDLTITLTKEGPNVINAYYYKSPEKPNAEEATLTIKHNYYLKNQDGSRTLDGTRVEFENKTVYVGEWYFADMQYFFVKDGETLEGYRPVKSTTYVNITAAGSYELVVDYEREAPKVDASVVVNHSYWTEVWTPVEVEAATPEVTDPDTGEVITPAQEAVYEYQYVRNTEADKTDKVKENNHKEGDLFNLAERLDGYEFERNKSDVPGTKALTAGENVFNMSYVKYQGGPNDGTDESASVAVVHVYTEYKTYVNSDGVVVYDEPQTPEEVREDTVTGYPGETFYAEKKDENEFVFVSSDTPDLKVTLRTAGGEYYLRYEKHTNALGDPVPVKVQPIFKTYTTSIDENGRTVRELTNTETAEQVELLGSYYVGQRAVAIPGGYNKPEYKAVFDKDGNPVLDADGKQVSVPVYTYTPSESENTPDAAITVSAEVENVITLVYVKDEDTRVPAAVAVQNHYTTLTKSMDESGQYHEDWTISADKITVLPGLYYVGQVINTAEMGTSKGFALDNRDGVVQPDAEIQLTEQYTMLDFYWYREVGDMQPTTVQVIHHYAIVDKNTSEDGMSREWTVGDQPEDVLKGYTVGWTYVASPNYADGQFDESHITGASDKEAMTKGRVLAAGENVIHIYYEKQIDTRALTKVTVYHWYYSSASAETPAFADMVETDSLRVGDSFTATAVPTKNGVAYTQTTPDSELTKELIADSGSNIIIIRYVLAETTYKVVHTYYTNGSLTGSTDPVTVGGNVGDVVTADSVAKVLTYGGNSYSYTSSSGEFTLVQGENGTITLRYDRTTGGGGDNGGGNNNNNDDDDDDNGSGTPTPPVVDVPDEQPPLIEEPVIDIPDEQPPKEEAPEEEILEEEILEEEVPLSDVPQTGDNSKPVFWAVLGALSFLGIVLLGRKRKDEEA